MLHQMMAKAIPTIVHFTIFILVNQNICDRYKSKPPYGRNNNFYVALGFALGMNFIIR